jgi:hypothetical protein
MMMRTRWSIVLFIGVWVASCSTHRQPPTAPEPPVPEPPLGGMVAKIDGVAWTPAYPATASPSVFGSPGWYIIGLGNDRTIDLVLPGAAMPKPGNYIVGDIEAGAPGACVLFLVAGLGWESYCTETPSAGFITITRADSVNLAGTFRFTLMRNSTAVHVTSGAFNVPVDSLLTLEGQTRADPGKAVVAGPQPRQ